MSKTKQILTQEELDEQYSYSNGFKVEYQESIHCNECNEYLGEIIGEEIHFTDDEIVDIDNYEYCKKCKIQLNREDKLNKLGV